METPPQTIVQKYNADIPLSFTFTSPETREKKHILMLLSRASKKIALLTEKDALISFTTPFGPQEWVNGWGLLENTGLLLIDDGMIHSLGIYRLDGTSATLTFTPPYGTEEVVHRIEKILIDTGDNPYILRAKIGSIGDREAYGPE